MKLHVNVITYTYMYMYVRIPQNILKKVLSLNEQIYFKQH